MSPRKGIGLVSLLFGKIHSFFLIRLRFERTSAPQFFCFFWFYRFPDIFLFYRFYCETDMINLQVYIYLASVLFLLQMQWKHQQSDIQSRCWITHIGIIPQQNDFVFRFHFDSGMIPPFCQSSIKSEIMLFLFFLVLPFS